MNSWFTWVKRNIVITMLYGVFIFVPAASYAFHEDGVGKCGECHVMHGIEDGQPIPGGATPGLLAATATDVCLMCHGGQNGVFGHQPMNPPDERGAGNFVFLLEDNINDGADGFTHPIAGESSGHSIISMDFGVGVDTRWTYAPGGNYPSSQMGCTSCHDPHGNQNFRMLYGQGPIQDGLFEFNYPAPEAVGLDVTDPLAIEAPDQHTAYLRGMSDWCANCHGFYHGNIFGPTFEHKSDENFDSKQVRRYNQYNGASDPHGGFPSTAYLPAVPFESGKSNINSMEGVTRVGRIMCLTCHRAHASSAPQAGRWDFNIDLLDDDGGISGSWPIPNPYNDPEQGQLCDKCHRNSISE